MIAVSKEAMHSRTMRSRLQDINSKPQHMYRIRPHTRSQFRSQPQPGRASSAQYATQPADPYYGRGKQLSISSILSILDLSDNSPVPPAGPYDNSDPYDRGVYQESPVYPPLPRPPYTSSAYQASSVSNQLRAAAGSAGVTRRREKGSEEPAAR
jgi:hypothetical protein